MNITSKDIKRFWSKVNKNDSCWLWVPPKTDRGYGQFQIKQNGKFTSARAHRVSWVIRNGAIQNGLLVCHKCDVPACVNPDHLFIGTALDNNRDMIAKGRKVTTISRGEKNGRRTKPECTARGESASHARLKEHQVLEIRRLYDEGCHINMWEVIRVTSRDVSATNAEHGRGFGYR